MTDTPQPLLIERVIDAPRERVWKAWTDPEQMMRWWGPEAFTSPACTMDFHVGGKYLFCMRSPDDKDFWTTGTYKEIVEPEKIVCTDSFSDAEGNIVPGSEYGMGDDFPLELLITVTFEDLGDSTRMTLKHEGLPAGGMADDTREGWNGSFDKLAAFVEQA